MRISQHLRAAGVQRYFHRRGPKWYTTAQLVLGLAVREAYRLSYRESARFLDEYYNLSVHWTTLQKAAARLPAWFWHRVLRLTAPVESMLAAIDATGYACRNPSEHYLRRIDGVRPAVPVKLSVLVDTDSRRVLAARVRLRPAGDVRDVHGLVQRSHTRPWSIVMDKGYDSEPLHEWLDSRGIWSISPPRKGAVRGAHRLQLRDAMPEAEYGQRNMVEAVFKSLKGRFGGHVRARKACTVRAELMLRLIIHNIRTTILTYFLHTQHTVNIYKHHRPRSNQ